MSDGGRDSTAGGTAPLPVIEEPKPSWKLTAFALTATCAWLLFVGQYVWAAREKFVALEPNAFGDFLAGAFAPLAFLWLVVGFFQQGKELKYSGRALWLQGEELRNSVEQQRDLVNVTREQFALEGILTRPILKAQVFTGGWTIGPDPTIDIQFIVQNHGQLCTDVRVSCEFLPLDHHLNALGPGEDVGTTFTIPNDEETGVEVTVTFKDQRGVPGSKVFVISPEGGGFMVFEKEDLSRLHGG